MVRSLIVYLFLASQIAFAAAVPSGVPQVGIGATAAIPASSFVPLSNLAGGTGTYAVFTIVTGHSAAATAANFYPFYKNGVLYQVTNTKTAYCFNIQAAGGAQASFQLMSATATFAYNASSVTGGVYEFGINAYGRFTGATTSVFAPSPGTYNFGSQTWPGYQAGGNNAYSIIMSCYEN